MKTTEAPRPARKSEPASSSAAGSKYGRRRHKRVDLAREVTLVTYAGEEITKAFLLDISEGGARIQVPLRISALVPRKFVMWLSANGSTQRLCEMVWRSYTLVGIRFVKAKPRKVEIIDDLLNLSTMDLE